MNSCVYLATFIQCVIKSPTKVDVVVTGDRAGTVDRTIKALIDLVSPEITFTTFKEKLIKCIVYRPAIFSGREWRLR